MTFIKRTFLPVFIICCFCQCSKTLSPVYLGYENFRIEKVGFTENILATDVRIFNPNKFLLQLRSADVEMHLNDRFLGKAGINDLISLPGRDTVSIPLRLQVQGKDLVAHTIQVLLNPNVMVKIKGNAKAGRHGFFINVPIDYEGKQKIEWNKN